MTACTGACFSYGRGPARASAPFGAGGKSSEPVCEPLADPLYSELSYHVDATLAEVDMDEFYRGDINRILEISGYADQEELYEVRAAPVAEDGGVSVRAHI